MGKRDETLWKQRLKELKAYKKKNGNCLVPNRYEPNAKLGRWVKKQRRQYKNWQKGLHSQLTQDRIDELNELDFAWDVGRNYPRDNTVWTQHFNELVKYKKKYGDCLVPKNYEQNPKLGIWVQSQRSEYKKWLKGKDAFITQERIDQLNKIDFVWEVGKHQPDDTLWKQRFNELVKYKKKHSDCLVSRYDSHNVKLGRWVMTQRQQYKRWLNGLKAHITQERIDQLNEIDFAWDVKPRRKSKESNRSNRQSSIPSVHRHNVASATNKSNRPKKRPMPSKDRPKKRQRRRQSQDVGRELSPSERKERRRFALQALKNWRNPVRPDEVVSI